MSDQFLKILRLLETHLHLNAGIDEVKRRHNAGTNIAGLSIIVLACVLVTPIPQDCRIRRYVTFLKIELIRQFEADFNIRWTSKLFLTAKRLIEKNNVLIR